MARVLNHGKTWTQAEELKLCELYPKVDLRDFAGLFDRSPKALRSRARVLGLRKEKQRKEWNSSDVWMLRTFYPHISTAILAQRVGSTVPATYRKARLLGLHKTQIYLDSADACRLRRGDNVGAAFRFQKGIVPANKGLRRPGYSIGRGRMRETQFCKGQQPHNTMPMWSFRWYAGGSNAAAGYLVLKTGKRGPKPLDGWEFVHKLIWEQAKGPLPDWRDARIWWKDGDHGNCALSNLELITAQEHMARTTVHTLPAPLPQLLQLAGALKRKIRNREEKLNGKEHIAGSAGSSVRDTGSAV